MLEITIDTNIIAEENSPTLQYLINAHQSGLLDVAVASRFWKDKDNDSDHTRVERQRQIVGQLNVIPSGFIIGGDKLGNKVAVLIDDRMHQQLSCLFDIDTSTRGGIHSRYDVDHIYSHLMLNRDIFLTYEEKLIKKRMLLKEVGINLAHPDKFVEAIKETYQHYPEYSSEFLHHLYFLLDQMHQSPINGQLFKRLQGMRQAQDDIDAGRFSKEDEKAIQYMATNFKAYNRKPLEVAVELVKQQYHGMKVAYLSRYPSQPIISKNIIRGLKEIYGRVLDREIS